MNIIQIQSIASRVIDALTEAGSQEDIEKVKAVVKEVLEVLLLPGVTAMTHPYCSFNLLSPISLFMGLPLI